MAECSDSDLERLSRSEGEVLAVSLLAAPLLGTTAAVHHYHLPVDFILEARVEVEDHFLSR